MTITDEGTSRMVNAGHLKLHVNEAGEGPPLVLLHGGGPGATGWSNFRLNVEAFAQHYRVILVDQPGYGRSDKPDITEPLFGFYARTIRDLLDSMGIEKAHLLGNSLGGGTAVKLALDYTDRVDRLILMGPAGLSVRLFFPYDFGSRVAQTILGFYANPTRQGIREFCEWLLHDPSFATDELVEERFVAATDPEHVSWMGRLFATVAQGMASGTGAALPESDLWKSVDRIPHRTLLTWGLDDQVIPIDCAFLALRTMPDARLHVFPNCGHWAQVEHQEEFERVCHAFLASK